VLTQLERPIILLTTGGSVPGKYRYTKDEKLLINKVHDKIRRRKELLGKKFREGYLYVFREEYKDGTRVILQNGKGKTFVVPSSEEIDTLMDLFRRRGKDEDLA
jgi:hypothetical protein